MIICNISNRRREAFDREQQAAEAKQAELERSMTLHAARATATGVGGTNGG